MARTTKVFSGIDELPHKKAPEEYVQGCMALEGGAFRGVYTSGVLDFLMEKGINMTTTVGVSAGALNGMNYVSGDIGRSALCNLKHRHDSRWVGVKAIVSDRSVIGFHFLRDDFNAEYPFDRERFLNPVHKLVAVATNLRTGEAEYFDSQKIGSDGTFQAIFASASMPYVSKPIKMGDDLYLDGGCARKLPIRWALEQNFDKLIFVATNHCSYRRKEKEKEGKLLKTVYRDYPEFRKAMVNTNAVYNEDCDRIDALVKEGKIFRISPSEPVTVTRLEGDMEKLGALYHLGYQDAMRSYDALKEYLQK